VIVVQAEVVVVEEVEEVVEVEVEEVEEVMKVFEECVTGEENSQNEKLREELRI
jgi:hypothetical protein